MNPYGTYFQNKDNIWIYSILLISAVLPALLAVKNIGISPDSIMYALVSQEITSGNGIRLPMIYDLRDNYVFINGTIPFVYDPPLFPLFLALFGGVTPQSFLAAQILNVISHAVTAIFSFLLMKKIYGNNVIALLTGILVSFSYPLLWDTHRMLTESLFIALTILAIYFLTLSRHSEQYRFNRNLFIASICISAAVLTRFAGVALIPVFFWVTFTLVKNKSLKLKYISNVLTAILPIITSGAFFFYIYISSGLIQGANPSPTGRSYLDAFTITIKMIFLQFDLGDRPVTLIIIFWILIILYMIVNTNARRELLKYVHSGLDLIIVFTISYTALITYAMATSQTVIEVRYMSPLVPFLFILSMITIVIVREVIKSKGLSKLSLCGMLLSIGIIMCCNSYKTYMNAGKILSKQEGQYRILNSPTYNWIKENYGEDVIITSNRPYHLSFFGGYSTVRLPHKRFEIYSWTPDNMESYLPNRMSKFGSRVLVLFEKAEEQYEGSYITGLFNKREDNENFVLIKQFSDGVVYKLK